MCCSYRFGLFFTWLILLTLGIRVAFSLPQKWTFQKVVSNQYKDDKSTETHSFLYNSLCICTYRCLCNIYTFISSIFNSNFISVTHFSIWIMLLSNGNAMIEVWTFIINSTSAELKKIFYRYLATLKKKKQKHLLQCVWA